MGATGRSYREILAFYFPGAVLGITGRGLTWQRLGGERVALFTTQPSLDGAVLALAERELGAAAERLRVEAPAGVEIRLYPDLDTFRNVTAEPGWVAARTDGRRVHLQPAAVLRSHAALESTMRHEMLHVVVESQANAGLPVWFREGLVEHLAGAGKHAAGTVSEQTDRGMRQRGSPAEAQRAYEQAADRVAGLVRQGQAERGLCRREGPGGDRSLLGIAARLVRAGYAAAERRADLQPARCRACLGQASGLIQDGPRLIAPCGEARFLVLT
jgi:stage II sporulation protein D